MSESNSLLELLAKPPSLSRFTRMALVASMHLVLFTAAFFVSFLIRFDFGVPEEWQAAMLQGLPLFVGIKLFVFGALRMFQGWWRYVSLYDIVAMFRALIISGVVTTLLIVFSQIVYIPRTIYVLDFGLSLVFIGAARGSLRLLREAINQHVYSSAEGVQRILILGAGDTGETLLREINKNRNLAYKPIGFLDDDPTKRGLRIHNLPVLGTNAALPELVATHQIKSVIIAMPSASKAELRRVVELAKSAGVTTQILPAVESILSGQVSLTQLREVNISDLLGRSPVQLDSSTLHAFLQGKRVLVTGAGGSIGSELCRQVLRFFPEKLLMVERGETPLFFINRELREHADIIEPCIADITDRERLEDIFAKWRPDVVLHAAAYKHVPMMEANPCEAVKNNVLGTQNVADLALEHNVSDFVLISTDKAVNPTSVMGATKRITELYLQTAQQRATHTKFCAVRFGNVLGSNGSVVPIFREQIRRGGPLTVTHRDMTRFFMTIPEAVQLVLQAGALGKGGEIFILDMGEPVKIDDLARDMIRLSGLTEDDIEIRYTGIRPGEKLYEELSIDPERMDKTTHEKIFISPDASMSPEGFSESYDELVSVALQAQPLEVRRTLKQIIPTYAQPKLPDNVVSLDKGRTRQPTPTSHTSST